MERKTGGSPDHSSIKMLNTKVCKCSFCTRFCSRTSWTMGPGIEQDTVTILKNDRFAPAEPKDERLRTEPFQDLRERETFAYQSLVGKVNQRLSG